MLKLMQALEAAQQPSSGSDSSSAYRTLTARLQAAEQGGVNPAFMQPAKAQLRKLLMADVKKAVETALKIRPGRRAALKTGAVRDALDQAECLLETGLGDEAEPFLSSAQNWRALHVKTGVNGQLAGGHAGDRGEAGGAKPVSGDLMAIPDAAAVKRMLGEAYRSATCTCTSCRCSSACLVCFSPSWGVTLHIVGHCMGFWLVSCIAAARAYSFSPLKPVPIPFTAPSSYSPPLLPPSNTPQSFHFSQALPLPTPNLTECNLPECKPASSRLP